MAQTKKSHYVYCSECGCRLKINGTCKICGHKDKPADKPKAKPAEKPE